MESKDATSFFLSFKRKYVSTTVLNSFNNLIDCIEWTRDNDDNNDTIKNEILSFASSLDINEIVDEIYTKKLSAVKSKSLALNLNNLNSFKMKSITRDEFISLFSQLSDEAKKFVYFIFASPKLIFEYYSKKYHDSIFDDATAFTFYVETMLQDSLSEDILFGPFSIIDCLTNPAIVSSLLTELELSDVDNAEVFWAKLDMILSYGKTTGKDKITSFQQALTVMEKLAPTWNQLRTSSSLAKNDNEMDAKVEDSEGTVDDVVAAYKGNYNVVPSNYKSAKRITTGLVSNFVNFNKLSEQRKLQVCNYLLNNRVKFNEILQDSCQIVSDSIARDCDRFDSIDFSRFGVNSINRVGYQNSSSNSAIARKAANAIKSSFTYKVRHGTIIGKTNYIINCFIPIVNKFKSEVMNAYGSDSQRVFESVNGQIQIFGGSIYDDNNNDTSAPINPTDSSNSSGSSKSEPVVVEKIVEVPVQNSNPDPFDEIYSNWLFGGDDTIQISQGSSMSPEQLIQELEKAQIDFNKSYEDIYREIIRGIEGVRFEHVYKDTIEKVYPLTRIFNDVMIKKAMTTVYLSGLYGKKNRNNAYRAVVQETITTMKNANVPSFGSLISTFEKLNKLLIDSAEKAKSIHHKFVTSPRTSSSLLIEASHRVKIPCHLTAQDFNNFDEAVARMIAQLRNNTSQSSILNDREELKRYLDKASSRSGVIKSYFEDKMKQVDFEAAQIGNLQLRNTFIQTQKLLINQKMKYTLYVNDVIETQLTKQKMEEVSMKQLTKEEIKRIEKAFLLFRRRRISQSYKDEFKKLNKLLAEDKNIFEIANQMAVIFNAGRYIEFIATIYKELHIFGDNFNWEEFNRNMINFMVFNSLSTQYCLIVTDARKLYNNNIDKKVTRSIDNYCSDIAAVILEKAKNRIGNHNESRLVCALEETIHGIFDKYDGGNNHGFDISIDRSKDSPDFSIRHNGNQYIVGVTEALNPPPKAINYIKINANAEFGNEGNVANNQANCVNLKKYLYRSFIWREKILNGNGDTIVPHSGGGGNDYNGDDYNDANPDTPIKYALHEIPQEGLQFLFKMHDFKINPNRMSVCIKKSNEVDSDTKNNNLLIDSIFDSLMLNIMTIIDKYWMLKYNGTVPLPMNVQMMIKGGSVFDSEEFHDITSAEIIPEAVPFYITGLNVCSYYIKNLGNKAIAATNDDKKIGRRLKISKLSVLYPIAEIFDKYGATVQTISMNQLTTAIGVFNDIWNQTSGSNELKLSASIDMLLNELNASMFLGDELNNSVVENGYGSVGQFLRSSIGDIERILRTIEDVFKNAAIQSYNMASPEEEQIAFEKLMRDSYQKIKALPAEQRMTELRSLLTKKEDDDIGMHEYYKFMDLVIAPLITCAESYNNVFKLFEVFGVQNNEGLANTMDLRKYTIQKAKPNPDWINTTNAGYVPAGATKVDILKLPDNNNADATHPRFISDGTVNFWNFINSRNVSDEDVRFYLEDSPVVQRWNVFQFNKMLEKYARNRRLEAPNFWYVWNRNTWPIEPIISFNIKVHQGHTKAIESLRSVFSGFNAKTVADYLEFAIKEFANDLDQVIHLFMSYPGLSDRTIRALESYIHDQITADNILKKDNIKNMIALMKTIKVEKSKSYIYPTDIPGDLPVFTDNVTVIDSLKFINKSPIERIGGSSRVNSYIAQDNYKNMLNGYVQTTASATNEMGVIPSTNVYRDSMTDKNKGIVTVMGKSGSLFRNGWSDWAIGMLAKAHPQRVIPYKLAQMIIGDTVLGQVCKPMMNVPGRAWSYAVNVIGHKDIDVFFNNGAAPNARVDHRKETVDVYISPFTQNILARSITDSNKAVVDYAAFGQNSVNSLVSMLPFVISQLQNAYESMESTAVYYGIRGIEECGSLISILSKFYNEISTAITPISFLQKTISSYDVDHPLGELTKILDWSASGMQDFTQVEWANKYKFVNLHSITYPDFKNKDKFEWIHKFASNVFTHPIFSSNFKVILENMGKQTWNSLIANSFGSGRMFISVIGNETLKVIRSLLQQYITTGSTSRDELQYFFDMLFNNKSNAGIQVSSDSAIGNDGWNWGAGEGEVRMTGGISGSMIGGAITGVSEEFRKAVDTAAFKLQELDAESIANLSLGGIGNKVTVNQGLAAVAQAIESGASLYRALPDIKIPINKTLEVNVQTRNVLDDAVSTYIENKTTNETNALVNILEWNADYADPANLDITNVIKDGFLQNHFRKKFCNHLNTVFKALTYSAGHPGKDFSSNEIGSLAIRAFAVVYAIGAGYPNNDLGNIKALTNDGSTFDFHVGGGNARGQSLLAQTINKCPREMLVLWDTLSGINATANNIFINGRVDEDTFINFFRALDIANDMIQMSNDNIDGFGDLALTNKFKENVQKLTDAGRKIAEWCYGKKQNPDEVIGDLVEVEYEPNYREFIKQSIMPMQINERNVEIDTLINSLTWTRDLSNWKINAEQLMRKYRIVAQNVIDLSNTTESNSYLEPAKVTKNNKLLNVNQYLIGKGSKTQENAVIISEDVQGWLTAASYADETDDQQIIFTPIASYKMYKALTDYIDVVKQIEAELIDSPPFTGANDFITELQTKVDALADDVKRGRVIYDASAIARERAEIEGYGTNFARHDQLKLFPDLTIHPNWKRQFYPGALWSQYDYAANTIGNKANDDTSRLLISALNLKNEMEQIVKNNHYAIDEFIFDGLMKHNKLLANIADIIVTRTQPLVAPGRPDPAHMTNVVPRTFNVGIANDSKKIIAITAAIRAAANVNPTISTMPAVNAAPIPAGTNLGITKNMLGNDTIPDFFSLAEKFTNTNVTSNDDANATADLKTDNGNTVFKTAKSRLRDILTADENINSSSVFIRAAAAAAAVNAQNNGDDSPYGMNVIIQPVALDNGFQFLKINPWFVNGNNLNNNVQAIRSTDAHGKQLIGYGVTGANASNAGMASMKANVLNFIRTFKAITISDKVSRLISTISNQTKIINKKYKNDRLTGGLSSFTQLLNMNIPNMPNTVATALSVLGSENPFGAYRAYLSMSRNLRTQTRIKNINAIGRGVCQSFLTFMYTYVYGKLGKSVSMDLTDSFVGYNAVADRTVAPNRRERVFVSIANTDLRTYMQTFKDFDLARMNCGFMDAAADYPEGLMRIPGVLDKTGNRYYEAGSINSNANSLVRNATAGANATYNLKRGEWFPAAPAHTERRWEYITAWLLHKNENKLQNTRDPEFAKWFKAYQATFYVLLRERMQLAYEEYKIVRDYVRNATAAAGGARVNIPGVSGNQQTPGAVPQLTNGAVVDNGGYEEVIGGRNGFKNNPVSIEHIDENLHPADPDTDQKQDLLVVDDNRIAVMCYVSYLARFNKFDIKKENQLFGGIAGKLTTIQGQRSKSYVIYPAVDILVNTFKDNIKNPDIRVLVGLDRYNLFSHAMEAAVDNSDIVKVNDQIIIKTDDSVTIAYPILRYLAVAAGIVNPTAGFANINDLNNNNRDVDHNGCNYAILDGENYDGTVNTKQLRTGSLNKGNIYYFDIREFFEYVLQKNLDTFINVNISEADNYGFLIPHTLTGGLTGGKSNNSNRSKKNKSKRKHLMQLYGGADINSALDVHYDANSLMNNNAYGATPLKTMRHMYANRGIPYKIYAHLFNGGVYIRPDDENQIFKSAMNYFHKYNISMKSIFNSLCYAQLLTNRVQFNAIVNKLSKAVAALPAREDRNETNYSLARAYIVNVIDGDKPIWNRNDVKYDVSDNPNSSRPNHFNVGDYVKHIQGISGIEKQKYFNNIWYAPAINNNFVTAFLAHATDSSLHEDKVPYSMKLISSLAFEKFMRLDHECTYINMLILLLRLTSYYDTNNDTEVGFFVPDDTDMFDAL